MAGTSGVVYGVLGDVNYLIERAVSNTFAHANYTTDLDRLGVLLCINGEEVLECVGSSKYHSRCKLLRI